MTDLPEHPDDTCCCGHPRQVHGAVTGRCKACVKCADPNHHIPHSASTCGCDGFLAADTCVICERRDPTAVGGQVCDRCAPVVHR